MATRNIEFWRNGELVRTTTVDVPDEPPSDAERIAELETRLARIAELPDDATTRQVRDAARETVDDGGTSR